MSNQVDRTIALWVDGERRKRNGEAKRRLENGLGHAERMFIERIWLPAFQVLEDIYPEYEVQDFKDGNRYIDFAYIKGRMKVCIEIDGYGPHWRDLNRWQFADHVMRQNHLVIDGWIVLRFTYDDIQEKPRRCQQVLQQLLGRWFGNGTSKLEALNSFERDVIRLATQSGSFSVKDAAVYLGLTIDQARYLLKKMLRSGLITSMEQNRKRHHFYQLNTSVGL